MTQFVDIDKLLPDTRGFKFKDKSGVEYKIKMFIPAVASLIEEKFANDELKKQLAFLEAVCISHFDFMTEDWFSDNVSLEIQNIMFLFILDFMNQSQTGALKHLEKESSKKKTFSERFLVK